MTGTTVLSSAQQILRPAYARDVLHVGSSGLSLMVTVSAAGSVIGALLTGALAGRFRRLGYGLAFSMAGKDAIYVLYAFSRSFPLTLVLEFCAAVVGPYFMITATTHLQTSTPAEMRGRVMGVLWMMVQLNAFGALAAGILADATSETFALAFGSIARATAVVTVMVIAEPLRRLGRDA